MKCSRVWKGKAGMTIVEVMAAFAVLLLGAGAFMLCIKTANLQALRATELRADTAALTRTLAPGVDPSAGKRAKTYTFSLQYLSLTVKVQEGEINIDTDGRSRTAYVFCPPGGGA